MLGRVAMVNKKTDSNAQDILDINNLIVSYGFHVDACDADAVADLWTEDGEYIVHGVGRWTGREALKEMVQSDLHQSYVSAGCLHFMGPPQTVVTGDEARVHSNTLLIKYSAGHFEIDRVSDNTWLLVRTDCGWKVQCRENTLLAPKPA